MFAQSLVRILATHIDARENCRKSGNDDWFTNHTQMVRDLMRNHMPLGSGIDTGTKIYLDDSTSEKLVFECSFHHMDDTGHYDGWTAHKITVRPSLIHGYTLTISGRDRNDIKEYLHQTFRAALDQMLVSDTESGTYKLAA